MGGRGLAPQRSPGGVAGSIPGLLRRMRVPGALSAATLLLLLLGLLGLPWGWSAAAALGVYLGGGGWRFLRIVVKTARRDLL